MSELRETLQALEERNGLLQQELSAEGLERTAELAVEVEHLQDLEQHFKEKSDILADQLTAETLELQTQENRRVALEANHLRLAQRASTLEAETAQQQEELNATTRAAAEEAAMRESLEGELALVRRLQDDSDTSVRTEVAALAEITSELEKKKTTLVRQEGAVERADTGRAEIEETIGVQKAEFVEAWERTRTRRNTIDDLQVELEDRLAELESVQFNRAQVQDDASEIDDLRRDHKHLLQKTELQERNVEQLEQDVCEWKEHSLLKAATVEEQGHQQDTSTETEKLHLKLNVSNYFKKDALSRLAVVRERDNLCFQRYENEVAKLVDLEKRIAQEDVRILELQERVAGSEERGEQLRLLLGRVAPVETNTLDYARVQAPSTESKIRHLRAENARLRAAVDEQALRSAAEAQRLAQERARLRIMERSRCRGAEDARAQSGVAVAGTSPRVAEGGDQALAGQAHGPASPAAPRGPGTRQGGRRPSEMKENRENQNAGAAVPRRSILKKKPHTDGSLDAEAKAPRRDGVINGVAWRRLERPLQPNSSLGTTAKASIPSDDCPTQ